MVRELQPGDPRMIGPYRLRGQLGVGGMGRVFLGLSAEGRLVAVKLIRADLAADPQFRARFRQEVAVARKVSGPFTAPVVEADTDGPVPWLATAYVAGSSLDDAVAERGPLPTWSVIRLAAGLAEGLTAIHAAGVVHRDLKPSNVLLAKDGPRMIDFGLSVASGASVLAHVGLVGSPGYMSPEQAEGREVGPPGDVFSLGAVLAFAATGEGPFGTGSALALVYRVIHCPPDLDRVPAEVRPLVGRCLARDPGLRPTAREVLAEASRVRSMTGGHPAPAPDPVPVLSGTELAAPDLPPRLAAARLAPSVPAQGEPARHPDARRQDRHPWRRGWRPLAAAAAIIAGLAGAAATAGVTLVSAHSASHSAQSEGHAVPVQGTAPATFAPRSLADPHTSQPAAAVRKGPAPARVHTGPPAVAFTRAARTKPPAPPRTAPPKMPWPTRSATPPFSVAPTPSAIPTPASGGY